MSPLRIREPPQNIAPSIEISSESDVASPTASLPEVRQHPLVSLVKLLYGYGLETAAWTACVLRDERTSIWHDACIKFGTDSHKVIDDMRWSIATEETSPASFECGLNDFRLLCARYNLLREDFGRFQTLYPVPGTVNRIIFPDDPRNE